jgi:PPOX class probable F420-dependent enzyme
MTDAALTYGVPASHADLLTQPLVGVFTTVGRDGVPQSTAVWYLLDEGEVRVSVRTDRQKYRNLQRHPMASLLIVDPAKTSRTLEIRGDVEIRPDPGKMQAQRFAPVYGHATSAWDPPDVERAVLALTPRRIVTLG